MTLRLKKYPKSPCWQIRGSLNGITIHESTKTADRALAEECLNIRQEEFYRKAVLKDERTSIISREMLWELHQTAMRARNRAQKASAKERVTPDFVASLYTRQRGRCAVSGIDFHLEEITPGLKRTRAFAPSLDRIDNSKGYTQDNVRLVCRIANFAMNIWGDQALVQLSIGVTDVWEKMCALRVHEHSTKFKNYYKKTEQIQEERGENLLNEVLTKSKAEPTFSVQREGAVS